MVRREHRRSAAAVVIVLAFLATAIVPPTVASPLDTRVSATMPTSPCDPEAPRREYAVTALPVPLSYNHWGDLDLQGVLFVPNERRVPLLTDVGSKLAVAGLGELAESVFALRDALEENDVDDAVVAAQAVVSKAQTASAAAPKDRVAVSALAEPVVLRAHVGDCVTVRLLNVLPLPASFHAHAVVTSPGAGAAVGMQAPDLTPTGAFRNYTMYIPPWPGMEGAHFVHSHADSRDQTRHGLFGALVAEPLGSEWVSMEDGATEQPYGLNAIIDMPDGQSDFREFVQIYHDEVSLVDWQLKALPQVSPITGEYGPGTKAINLRSEPFYDRFKFHDEFKVAAKTPRAHDKSQSYGSYTYGDPAQVIQRSYLGDPAKFRFINAGPGQHHIHHLHGGGIRWRATPLADPTQFDAGLLKTNPVEQSQSQRLDVQNAAPGESFNLEPEGGSGGVQQSVGDFLYHCHIAEHYLSGMWSFWRVYNTLQADLAELPDRAGDKAEAVNSRQLLGFRLPNGTVLDGTTIRPWVEAQLPAKGVPGVEDASVWNWAVQEGAPGPLYQGEPETAIVWPNYPADAPGRVAAGTRPEIGFDPLTGRLAYPLLRPHFGERPPFAPDHGPAPYLSPDNSTNYPDGLCPTGARPLKYNMVAVQAPVKYNAFDKDQHGQVFVRAEDRAAATAPDAKPTSVLLRANTGDCVDVTLVNALDESDEYRRGIHSKTNIHIHLVQFDVQASDGVVAGFNYETTLRSTEGQSRSTDGGNPIAGRDPSAAVVTRLTQAAAAGSTVLHVRDVKPFRDAMNVAKVGSTLAVDLGRPEMEIVKLVAVSGAATGNREIPGTITLDRPLAKDHAVDARTGYEFVRYRWYPDAELGTVYFHDHVNGLDSWRRGLFGSLVVEPRGSQWLDPKRTADPSVPLTPAEVQVSKEAVSHVADILPGNGVKAFRELVLHFQDRACVLQEGDCILWDTPEMPHREREPAAFNLRSEPLHRRNLSHPFLSGAEYSKDESATPFVDETTVAQGDPATSQGDMLLAAYPGDKVVVRMLYAGQSASRGVGTFGITGHRFQVEQYLPGSRTTGAVSMAESTHGNYEIEAGGALRRPGDYMYWMTQPEYVDRGAWGLLRVHDPALATPIMPLPGQAGAVPTLPAGAAVQHYDVAAIEGFVVPNPNLGPVQMRRFVPLDQATSMGATASAIPSPLVLRAAAGEVVEVTLHNMLLEGRVGLHASMLSAAPGFGQGFDLGENGVSTVGPGENVTYRWYADREVGVVDLVSLGDPVHDALDGLVGALVVEPAGASFSPAVGPRAVVTADGRTFNEHVLLFSTEDGQFDSSTMPYTPDVQGLTLVNYATEPLTRRLGQQLPATRGTVGASGPLGGTSIASTCQVDPDGCANQPIDARNPLNAFATSGPAPWTPVVTAPRGQPLVLRIVGAAGDQLMGIHVDGHVFAADPDMAHCRTDHELCKSNLVSDITVGPRETVNAWIPEAGLGGVGDFLYRNHRDAFFEAGAWGILRVV